jgi:hypothetical protein
MMRRSRWFVPSLVVGGTAVGVGAVAAAMLMWPNPRGAILHNLRQTDVDSFASRIGGTDLIFPAESWASNRNAGVDFATTISSVSPKAWAVIAKASSRLRLSTIYFTSTFRATGTGPHTTGRALDVGYVQRQGDPQLTLLRRTNYQPSEEPQLAREFREALVQAGASQVLTPWWIYSVGTRNEPNTGQDKLAQDHLSHLHITVHS